MAEGSENHASNAHESRPVGHSDTGRLVNTETPERISARSYLGWGALFVLIAGWSFAALALGVNFASTFWEWLPVLLLGGGVPALVMWQANRVLTPQTDRRPIPSDKDKEKELLQALAERGEITPITASIRTSLTANEASKVLEELSSKGYLRVDISDGAQTYALGDFDRKGLIEVEDRTPYDPLSESPPQPLDDPLSEREMEVLALIASGRTGSEIASDLFVAVGTIKTHTNNIYRKLEVNKRSDAIARARELGLLP